MKLLWLGYLVYYHGNCVMKLCIETGLTTLRAACYHIGNGTPGGAPIANSISCCLFYRLRINVMDLKINF